MKSILPAGRQSAKLLFGFFLFFSAVGLQAQQATLSVQGVLTKADGTAVDDNTYNIEFSLWKSESSTAPADKVYTENISVQTTGGVYSVILGLAQPLTAPFNQPYWLGVKFGSTELLPRPRLTSAPFALSLLGQNNTFPSTGTVICDALNVAGAVNAGSVSASGNVSGANLSTGGSVNAASVSATGRVNSSDGFGYNSTSTGLFFDGTENRASIYTTGNPRFHAWDDGKNYYRAPNGHVFDLSNLQVNASIICGGFIRAGSVYTFNGDDDSGMYSPTDGRLELRVNNSLAMSALSDRVTMEKTLYLTSAPNMTDGDNLEWRAGVQGGRVGVNTSSRRYKYNIQPLQVDFTRILKVQPRVYNRISEGDDKWEIGYIAEEIDSLGMKDLVLYDLEGRPNSLIYKKFVIYTNEIVKMHHAEIEQLHTEVAALKAEKNALRAENEKLRAQQMAFDKQLDALARRVQSLETTASNR